MGGACSYVCQYQLSDLILCKREHRLEENRDSTIRGNGPPNSLRPVLLTLPLKEENNLSHNQQTSWCGTNSLLPNPYTLHCFTLPASTHWVTMTTVGSLCSQMSLRKSASDSGVGPEGNSTISYQPFPHSTCQPCPRTPMDSPCAAMYCCFLT